MRKNKRKWICILIVGITVLYQCGGSYGDACTGSADKGNNRLCEKEGQNVLL